VIKLKSVYVCARARVVLSHKLWFMLLDTEFVFLSRVHRIVGGACRLYL
jgi:hypothetical protein